MKSVVAVANPERRFIDGATCIAHRIKLNPTAEKEYRRKKAIKSPNPTNIITSIAVSIE